MRQRAKRRTILLLMCLPGAALALLCGASFVWIFLWAPPSTPAGQRAPRRASLHCGSLHYTNEPRELAWRTANPGSEMKPILGYTPLRQVGWPGIAIHRYPVPLRSAQWDTWYRPGNLKVPLLPATLILLFPSALLALRSRGKPPEGHCPKCRYNRAGLPETSPCPECGGLQSSNHSIR